MFLFQSSKDKQLKKIIQSKFQQAISSQTKYQSNKQIISNYCSSSDKKSIQKFVDLVKQTIKDDDVSPKSRYYAIKMLQDVMKTKNNTLGNYVVKKILKRLVIFAEYKKESKDEKRGKWIFGKVKPDQENYANKFHLTILGCLEEWGTTWPKGMEGPHLIFKEKYEELMKQKVTFPKIIVNAPQVLRDKMSKDKVNLKSFNQPKKFISPDRVDTNRDKRDSDYNSRSNNPTTLTQSKIIQINNFMFKIDQNFSLLEQLSMEQADGDILIPVVDQLRVQMTKGDTYVAELMGYNNKEFEPLISDIIADFEFIEDIDYDIKNKLKTERMKKEFVEKFRVKFEERKRRRSQNELRASIINKSLQKNKSFEGNNSVGSRKSEERPSSFQYPAEKNVSGDRISGLQKRNESNRESNRQSEKKREESESQSVEEEQKTGKFRTFRPQQVIPSQDNDNNLRPSEQFPNLAQPNKTTPPVPKSSFSSHSSQSQSYNNSSVVPPPIKRQTPNKPQIPSLPQPPSSSQNIHSTSIMKKFQSSNLINQSSNSNSNSKDNKSGFNSSDHPFSGQSKNNPIKSNPSNPYESNETMKKQFESNNVFGSFGNYSFKDSSKEQSGFSKPIQQLGYGKIQEHAQESEGNISDRKKVDLVGNPFNDSVVSAQKEKTNPFDDESMEQFQSYVSNPFSTQKSFMEKSNPFLSDSISSKSSQIVTNQIQAHNTFQKSNNDRSMFDKNNSDISNLFVKKSKLDINFDVEEGEKKSADVSEIKGDLKESDFMNFKKPSLKQDFFSDGFAEKAEKAFQKINNNSFFDQFNPASNFTTNVLSNKPIDIFANVKASNILTKKDMTTSQLEFNWFEPEKQNIPQKKQNEIFVPEQPAYPEFSERNSKAEDYYDKNLGLDQFNPPEIDLETTPKQSRISHPKDKDVTNPWPEISDLNISEFPMKDPTPSVQNNNQFEGQIQKLTFDDQGIQNSQQFNLESKRSKQENPFGLPNPQFSNNTFEKSRRQQPSSPNNQEFQMPSKDNDEFLFQNFRVVVQSGGSPWNPYKKKPTSTSSSPKKKPVFKFQIHNYHLQQKQAKQYYQQQLSLNQTLQQQVLAQRISYNIKLKQIQSVNQQKQQYLNLIKKSKEAISIQQSKIAQESKLISKLKVMKDRKNQCLKKLFEIQNKRHSVNQVGKSSRSAVTKVNKFLAFNETAKRMNSLATTNRNLSAKQTFKGVSFHHKH